MGTKGGSPRNFIPTFYFSKHFSDFPNYFEVIYSQCCVYIFTPIYLFYSDIFCINSVYFIFAPNYLLFIFIINVYRIFVF